MSDDGVVIISGKGVTQRFERRLKHPPERVWAALTEPDQMARWLAEADVDLREGGAIELRWTNGPAVLHGRFVTVDAPHVLEYVGDIHGRLRWELEPDGESGTLLTLTVTRDEGDMLAQTLAGWHSHLDVLERALDGGGGDWDRDADWEPHFARYDDMLSRTAAIRASAPPRS